MPCKHIFRLAEELGVFNSETFAPGEHDYTMSFVTISTCRENDKQYVEEGKNLSLPTEPDKETDNAETYQTKLAEMAETPAVNPEPVKYISAVVPEAKKISHKHGISAKLLKYAACCFFGFWAVVFMLLAFQDKTALCFSVGFAVAGTITAITANRKGEESAFK